MKGLCRNSCFDFLNFTGIQIIEVAVDWRDKSPICRVGKMHILDLPQDKKRAAFASILVNSFSAEEVIDLYFFRMIIIADNIQIPFKIL
jgi:hypothetical protein